MDVDGVARVERKSGIVRCRSRIDTSWLALPDFMYGLALSEVERSTGAKDCGNMIEDRDDTLN
jgi:predicted CDP-diglyceride synthetase/phosphatidate cytidylyltransferase